MVIWNRTSLAAIAGLAAPTPDGVLARNDNRNPRGRAEAYGILEKPRRIEPHCAAEDAIERRGITGYVLPWKPEQDKNQEQDAYTPRKQTEVPPGKPACVAPPSEKSRPIPYQATSGVFVWGAGTSPIGSTRPKIKAANQTKEQVKRYLEASKLCGGSPST